MIIWLVLALNVVRTVDDMVASPATAGEQAWVAVIAALAIACVLALTVRGWRGDLVGCVAVAGAGVVTMLIFGGEAAAQLSASQLVTELPTWVRRWTVGASYAVIAPTTAATVLAAIHFRRHLAQHPDALRIGRSESDDRTGAAQRT